MAGSLASINIRFSVDTRSLSTQLQNAGREAEKASGQFTKAGSTMTYGITAAVAGLGVASLKSFGDLEALQMGLNSVMGSVERAASEFEKLKEVAKLPGLGLEEAVRGSVNMQAAGFSADQARESLLAFGNALATVGKGARELDLVVLALTQLNNKSTGFGQDLRQLTEQLPQLRGALTAAFGTSDSEAIAKTGVTGRQVVMMLTKEFQKLPKVTGGFKNALENATDNLKISFAGLGESINKAFNVEGLLNSFGNSLNDITESFKSLSPTMQKVILSAAGIAAAIGPVLLGIGAMLKIVPLIASAVTALSASMAFLTANFVAIAAVIGVAVIAYTMFTEKAKAASVAQATLNSINEGAIKTVAKQKANITELLRVARDETKSVNERREAIKRMNEISPEYLGNLTLETINTDKAREALEKYNTALLQAAKAKVAKTLLDTNLEKQAEAYAKSEIKLEQIYAKQKEVLTGSKKTFASLQKSGYETSKSASLVHGELTKTLTPLKQEESILRAVYERFKDQLDAINENTDAADMFVKALIKPGTVAFYEDQIKSLQKLQNEFETTPESIAAIEDSIVQFQKKIDKLKNVKIKVTSVFENVKRPDSLDESQGTTDYYDKRIAVLKKMQSEVATTSDFYRSLEQAIAETELDKAVKFDINVDTTGLESADESIRVFGQKFKKRAVEYRTVIQSVADGFASAFEGLAGRFVDSLGLANEGMQGFFKGIAQTVIQLISAMLAQSLAQSIAGATAAGTATGPAAIVTTPAFIATAVAGVLGAFAAIPKFETGGVVPGNSFIGDKILTRLNSGELVLNQGQQNNLWDMINPAASSGDMRVQLMGGFEIEGTKLKLVLDRTNNRDIRIK